MADPIVERIRQHPQYPRLKTERSRLGWTLTILMLIVFTVLITGFYVHRANSRYDAMTRDILKETTQ